MFPDYRSQANKVKGIRNNNPGNIKNTSIPWKGVVVGHGGTFEQFQHIGYGLRALITNLQTYHNEGTQTIKDIISKWAPPSNNPTQQYIKVVSNQVGVPADKKIKFSQSNVFSMTRAIVDVECGRDSGMVKDKHIKQAMREYFDLEDFDSNTQITANLALIGAIGVGAYLVNQKFQP